MPAFINVTVKSLAMFGAIISASAGLDAAGAARAQTASPPGKTCVQVQIAGQGAAQLACLNQELQSQALAASGQSAATAPLDAGSPANLTGTFNKAGVAEQYGKNFGVSVIPYRPPPPVFASAVH